MFFTKPGHRALPARGMLRCCGLVAALGFFVLLIQGHARDLTIGLSSRRRCVKLAGSR
jgi:hypothetical protein